MNMAEKMVTTLAPGLAAKSAGMKAHCWMNWSPAPSSIRNISTFKPIRLNVTTGTVRRWELSSPIGNIGESAFARAGS
jgi:hypothetical protein